MGVQNEHTITANLPGKRLQKLKVHQPLKMFPACIMFSLLCICHCKSKDVSGVSWGVTIP